MEFRRYFYCGKCFLFSGFNSSIVLFKVCGCCPTLLLYIWVSVYYIYAARKPIRDLNCCWFHGIWTVISSVWYIIWAIKCMQMKRWNLYTSRCVSKQRLSFANTCKLNELLESIFCTPWKREKTSGFVRRRPVAWNGLDWKSLIKLWFISH